MKENKNNYGVISLSLEGRYDLVTFTTLIEAVRHKERMNFGNIIKFIHKFEVIDKTDE